MLTAKPFLAVSLSRRFLVAPILGIPIQKLQIVVFSRSTHCRRSSDAVLAVETSYRRSPVRASGPISSASQTMESPALGKSSILLGTLNQTTAYCVEAERAMSRVLGGSCQVPLGAFGEIFDGVLRLRGFVAQPDGLRIVSDVVSGQPMQGAQLGQMLAEKLIKQGADEILSTLVPAEGWK